MENIPQFLIELLEKQYNSQEITKIIEGYNCQRKATIRVNTLKTDQSKIKETLSKFQIEFSETKWSSNALIINNAKESQLQKLEIYENGEIYLQSLSSMLPPIILNPKENEDILDMCSAPRRKNNPNCSHY